MDMNYSGGIIRNVPEDVFSFKYIISRKSDEGDWYWGAWDNLTEAERVASSLTEDGIWAHVTEVKDLYHENKESLEEEREDL